MVHLLIIKLLLLLDLNLKTGLWVFLMGSFMNNLKNELLPDALESPPRIPWNSFGGKNATEDMLDIRRRFQLRPGTKEDFLPVVPSQAERLKFD
jgi:hypothetical protein